jgi:hypothetical protein
MKGEKQYSLPRPKFQRALGASAAPAGKAGKKGAHSVGENLHKQRQSAELRPRHVRGRAIQLGIEVLRERLSDAAHEIAHQAGAADLGQRAGE